MLPDTRDTAVDQMRDRGAVQGAISEIATDLSGLMRAMQSRYVSS